MQTQEFLTIVGSIISILVAFLAKHRDTAAAYMDNSVAVLLYAACKEMCNETN